MTSLTERKYRMCERKTGLSKARADMYVDEWAKKGVVMFYYLCDYCGMYHLTKKAFGEKPKITAKTRRILSDR